MIDKLEWNNNAFELMKYIGIIEDIYMPDFDNYEYRSMFPFVKHQRKLSKKRATGYSVQLIA